MVLPLLVGGLIATAILSIITPKSVQETTQITTTNTYNIQQILDSAGASLSGQQTASAEVSPSLEAKQSVGTDMTLLMIIGVAGIAGVYLLKKQSKGG